jgi:GGDEF domain-containing protein
VEKRRYEDQAVRVLIASPAGDGVAGNGGGLRLQQYAFDAASGVAPVPDEAGDVETSGSVLVIPLAGDEVLFITGAEVERLRGGPGATLLDRAAAEAVAWRRRRLRAQRQQEADERLIVLSELLNRERSREALFDAVMEHGPRVVGGHAMLLLLRAAVIDGASVSAVHNPRFPRELPPVPLQPFLPAGTPGVITEAQVQAAAPFEALAPLFDTGGAACLPFVPLGDRGILALVERRHDRVLEPEDWFRFNAIARHVSAALERLQLRDQAQSMSLIDPVTGLGNRRKLDVMLPYHIAAARRGVPLALVYFELGDANEAGGSREAMLHLFGECLQKQCRASDVSVHFGEAKFLSLLPNTTGDGAWALAGRVRRTFGAPVRMRVGVASWGEPTITFARLLEEAGRTARELAVR